MAHGERAGRGVDFSRNASVYDDRHGAFISDDLARRLIAEASLAPASRVLDVGAGTGRVAVPLAAHGCRLAAVDLAPAMLQRLREKTAGGALHAAIGAAAALPFRSASFDAVVVARLLYLVPDWRVALDEAARALKRDGRLLHEWGNGEAGEPWVEIRDRARELFESAGVGGPFHPGARGENEIDGHLGSRGFVRASEVSVPSGATTSVGRFLERIDAGECSYTWSVPDAVRRACLPRLRAWAEARFGLDLIFAAPRAIRWAIYRRDP